MNKYEELLRTAANDPATGFEFMKFIEENCPELIESEDEKIRKWLIRTLKSLNSTAVQIDGACEMMLPAIAWLEKQGEQKGKNGKDGENFPITAWSEEDESMLTEVILDLEVLMDKDPGEEGKAAYQREIVWLESFKDRITWKPSEAQMASITCAVRKMKESACYDSELVSLLNDLKKLKRRVRYDKR